MSPIVRESSLGDDSFLWPASGDTAFAPGDLRQPGTANLEFLQDRWHAYADGYRRAATIVATHLDSARGDEDRVVFALLGLWRHYLELKLKALIPDMRELPGGPSEPVPVKHDLTKLWSIAEP